MEKKFYVYIHRRATDGRVFYVGKGHGDRLSRRSSRNLHWHNIVNKHGFTAHIVIRFDREECAFSFERALIKRYGIENLCNITDGGEGPSGHRHTKELKDRFSRQRIGDRNQFFGRKHTSDSIAAMRNWHSSKSLSKEHINKIREKSIGDSNPFFGKHHTEATMEKMRANHRLSKPVVDEFGNEFRSAAEAARHMVLLGFAKATRVQITKCCNGSCKTAYGRKWRLIDDHAN